MSFYKSNLRLLKISEAQQKVNVQKKLDNLKITPDKILTIIATSHYLWIFYLIEK